MISRRWLIAVSCSAVLVTGVAACGSSSDDSSSSSGSTESSASSSGPIVGAGSTLVLPLVSKWESDYKDFSEKKNGTATVLTYGGVGSGAGIEQITAGTVDFGASDAPFTPDQQSAAENVLQIPWALSATDIAYNVSGLEDGLKLDPATVADIYLGNVKTWDDPAIAKLNPDAKLPSTKITPVYRSDGSGDTYALTDLLSKVSPDWKSKVGTSTEVKFPVGVGAEHNDGVAAALSKTEGAITYVGAAYADSNDLTTAALKNEGGAYVQADVDSIAAAAATVRSVPDDNAISITDPPASAKDAYPLATFTYALVPSDSANADSLKEFLTYAIGPGQEFGPDLFFAPLSKQVLAADKATIAKIGG